MISAELSDLEHTVSLNRKIFPLDTQENIFVNGSVTSCQTVNSLLRTNSQSQQHSALSWLHYYSTCLINPTVTAAETGRGAEAAGGAGPAGGADSAAVGGGPTENQS